MFLLSLTIVFALLITLVLPLAAAFWLNKKLAVRWQVVMYGAMAYFILQTLLILLFSGYDALVENGTLVLTESGDRLLQIALSLVGSALLGVAIRWAGMRFLKEDLITLESAYGIAIGYGGVESLMLVGLPLLSTFTKMLQNINIDLATTALDPEIAQQLLDLWQVPAYLPLAGALERLSALVMHITVTLLILRAFTRKKHWFLAAAFSLELFINGIVIGLSELGWQYGWIILISVILMAGNIALLYFLDAHKVDFERPKRLKEEREIIAEQEKEDQDE